MMRKYIIGLFLLLGCTSAWAEAPLRMVPGDSVRAERAEKRQIAETQARRVATTIGAPTLIPRIPVIMVEFSDFSFTRTKEQVDSLFNAKNYNEVFLHATAQGSVRQYFIDQSMGQYTPQFDIYGPIRVNKSCCASFANDDNVHQLVVEACTLMNDSVDFSQYDADGDGQIDLVYVYYAGFGRNDVEFIASGLVPNKKQLINPHWSILSSSSVFDGKHLYGYECANELDGYWTQSMTTPYPAGIGVAVHEFCHAMGIPDLYPRTNSESFKHLGSYDIMDYGPYNDEMFAPPSLSAYERWFLGWLTPTLLNSPQNVELGYIGETNQAYLITLDGQPLAGPHATSQPYYLLENRQKRKWDAGLLGHGMLMTRVTYDASAWTSNSVNNDRNNQRVKLIAADGDYSLGPTGDYWYGKPGDLFPTGATSYTDIPNFPITNITEDANGVIHFHFMGGTPTGNAAEQATYSPGKKIQNGQLVIVRDEKEYTVMGVRLR